MEDHGVGRSARKKPAVGQAPTLELRAIHGELVDVSRNLMNMGLLPIAGATLAA
jgi:hypothetical protein